MTDQKVSVVIPAYNCSRYIPAAIESVLAQTYDNIEIVVVDDGSTDNLKDVLTVYGSKIKYVYQDNSGPSAARNNGIRHASGEYIAFLDADDEWFTDKLSKQVRIFKQDNNIGLVAAGYYRCAIEVNGAIQKREPVIEKSLTYSNLLIKNSILTSSCLVKKKCFDKVGFFNEKYRFAEDWDMWLRIAQVCNIGYTAEPLCNYSVRINSLTTGLNPKNMDDLRRVTESNLLRCRSFYHKHVSYRKSWSWFYYLMAYVSRENKHSALQRKYLLKSIVTWPFCFQKRLRAIIKSFA